MINWLNDVIILSCKRVIFENQNRHKSGYVKYFYIRQRIYVETLFSENVF